MRRIALTLFAFSLVAVSPAAADLEDCIGALEAVETYREAIEPADAAFHQARREADEVHGEATRRAHQAWGAAHGDQAAELRDLNPYGNAEERAQYEALRAEIEARYAPRINAAYRMWDEADIARDKAWDQARATYEQIEAPAKEALMAALREAYPGPTSDNSKIMNRLLGKFLQECQRMLR